MHKKATSNKGIQIWNIKAQTILNNLSVTIGIMVSSKLILLFAFVLWASVSSNKPTQYASHRTSRQLEMAKKYLMDFEGAMRTPSPRASKWAPTWWSGEDTPKPFNGQPAPDPIQRLATKGFGSGFSRLSSGGSFRSSGWGRSHGTPQILWTVHSPFQLSLPDCASGSGLEHSDH